MDLYKKQREFDRKLERKKKKEAELAKKMERENDTDWDVLNDAIAIAKQEAKDLAKAANAKKEEEAIEEANVDDICIDGLHIRKNIGGVDLMVGEGKPSLSDDERLAPKRQKDRERKRRSRAKNKNKENTALESAKRKGRRAKNKSKENTAIEKGTKRSSVVGKESRRQHKEKT